MRLRCSRSCRASRAQIESKRRSRAGVPAALLTGRRSHRRSARIGRNWDLSRSLLVSYGIQVEAVTATDAEWAAGRWAPGEGLSLADRLCMALGDRLDADIWTADQAWGTSGRIRQVR